MPFPNTPVPFECVPEDACTAHRRLEQVEAPLRLG